MKNLTLMKPHEHRKSGNHVETLQPPALVPPESSTQVSCMTAPSERKFIQAATLLLLIVTFTPTDLLAAASQGVPHGTKAKAIAYYTNLSAFLEFRDPATITNSTLDDVPAYFGYAGVAALDLQNILPESLMDSATLAIAVTNSALFHTNFDGHPLQPGEILSSRFFAPKIINVNDPPATRALGWRKLVRLRARTDSPAAKHGLDSAIILFNQFTQPGVKPFEPKSESVNTQVILTSTAPDHDSIYWLDYGRLSQGGKLSFQLDASFDASDFDPNTTPGGASGVQPYFVPDGCVGCHGGENAQKALVNYLDTDHWFDRLDNDFGRLRLEGGFVLVDAKTDDPNSPAFRSAFDVIRRFNAEAEAHAAVTQPGAFHRQAALKWMELHKNSDDHFPPIGRAVQSTNTWSLQSPDDAEAVGLLSRYCFRCHGTIKFNVFDKAAVKERVPQIRDRLKPISEQLRLNPRFLMPLDRKMDTNDLNRLLQILP